MWYGLWMSPNAAPEFVSSATELLQSTSRRIVLITGGLYVAWQLAAAMTWPETIGWDGWPITLVVVLAFVLSLWLLPKWLLASQVIWQIGVAGAVTLALYTFRQPVIGCLYALLPLMAVVTAGWPAGLLAEGLVIGLVWWLAHSPAMPPLPLAYTLAIIIGGVLTGLLGWAPTQSLLTVTQWSLFSFEQARRKMEEARDQRLELKQIQEDLIHANRELARLSDQLKAMHFADSVAAPRSLGVGRHLVTMDIS